MADIVAIVGSRDFPDAEAKVTAYVQHLPDGTTVVSGGASGPDTYAERAARARGLQVMIFAAQWDKHGRSAGYIRNKLIVGAADRVVAFYNGTSKGTALTIDLARKARKPVEVISP